MFTMRECEFIRDSIDLEMKQLEEEMKQLGIGYERYKILKDIRTKVKENIIKAGV